jgi:hypothetical protein
MTELTLLWLGAYSKQTLATSCVINCLVYTAATRKRHKQRATEHTTQHELETRPAALAKLQILLVSTRTNTSRTAKIKLHAQGLKYAKHKFTASFVLASNVFSQKTATTQVKNVIKTRLLRKKIFEPKRKERKLHN